MQTIQQITQECIAQVQGASFTDETKFEESFVDNLVHQVRADLFRVNQNNLISNLWQQSYFPTYSEYINEDDDCTVSFDAPAPILGRDFGDMTSYVGPQKGNAGYSRIGLYGSEYVDFAHPITNPNKKGVPSYMLTYNNSTGRLLVKIYGNIDIKSFRMDFIHYDPTQNPSYRRSTDLYPISGELLIPLKTGVMNKLMSQMSTTPADNLSNSEDLYNQINTQRSKR